MILKISMRFIRFNPVLFVGAFITMVIGSMLIATSAMGLAAAIGVVEKTSDVRIIVVMSMFGTLSGFIAFSIVSGTFALSVVLRRKELALFRLTGGSGRQLRRMVTGEALIISVVASLIGTAIAYGAFQLFLDAINHIGIHRKDLVPVMTWLPLLIAFFIGIMLACLGASSASSRAAKAPPAEALRDSGIDTKVMTSKRITWGVIMLACAVALFIVAIAVNVGFDGAVPIVLFGAIFFAIAATTFGSAYLPKLGYLLAKPFASSVTGNLAAQGIKTSKRIMASLVAPVVSSVSIIATMALTFGAMDAMPGADPEAARQNQAIMMLLIIPSVVFSAISIINTLAMANSARKNDITKMRLLGVSKSQIRAWAVLESVIVTVLGAITGIVISFLAAVVFNLSLQKSFDLVPFVYPWGILGIIIAVYLAVGIIASVWTVHRSLD